MNAQQFIISIGEFFDCRLRETARRLANGKLTASGAYSFPTMLRVVETPHHFIGKLLGAHEPNRPTEVRLRRPNCAEVLADATTFFNSGFNIGDGNAGMLEIRNNENLLSQLTIATPYDAEVFQAKIGFPLQESIIVGEGRIPLSIYATANRFLARDLSIIRTDDFRVLFRTIGTALCVQKSMSKRELEEWLECIFTREMHRGTVLGLNLRFSATREAFARDLCSLADQATNEITVDQFIASHGSFFAEALGYESFISQPQLKWVHRGPLDPVISKPDYLMRRKDGDWDILDLKRALLRFNVVQGIPRRPRFHHYVADMVAQLVRYESYFENGQNAAWAESHLGVRTNHPKLIGIVGNFDTFESSQVELAMQQYREHIAVLSYADVINMLRSLAA